MKTMLNGKVFTQTGNAHTIAAKMMKNGEEKMKAFLAEKFPEIYGEKETIQKTSEISKIRKAVVTLANKINSKIKNLSKAFKKAWAVIKGKTIQSKVAGVSFGNTQKALSHLTKYAPETVNVELVRESNEHDENAVAVTVSVNNGKNYKIGFLPRELAQYMAKIIDNGMKLKAAFKGVTGGNDYYYGAMIELRI